MDTKEAEPFLEGKLKGHHPSQKIETKMKPPKEIRSYKHHPSNPGISSKPQEPVVNPSDPSPLPGKRLRVEGGLRAALDAGASYVGTESSKRIFLLDVLKLSGEVDFQRNVGCGRENERAGANYADVLVFEVANLPRRHLGTCS